MSPGTDSGNERRIWRLAEGALRRVAGICN